METVFMKTENSKTNRFRLPHRFRLTYRFRLT